MKEEELPAHLEEGFHCLGVASCHDDFTRMNMVQSLGRDIGGSGGVARERRGGVRS